jgi:tellurite resistance protein
MADMERLEDMFDVRDYAFNNVAVMVAADNQITGEEKQLLRKLARKWGYNLSKIEPTIEMAVNRKLPIRMPDNPKKRKKIYNLMVNAAKVDGLISTEEQQLLDNIKAEYLG